MTLPISAITKLLAQLAVIAPQIPAAIEQIRRLIDAIRKGGGSTEQLEDHLKRAIELQDTINKEMNNQLQIIKSVLENVQKSLKLLSLATVGIATVVILTLVLALAR